MTRSLALAELLARAARLPHSGRTFLDHLVGTHRILVAWRQPSALCAAGLLHSAYATELYPHAIVRHTERQAVSRIVGPHAEHLIHAFCTIDRGALWRLQHVPLGDSGTLRVPRWSGGSLAISATDARALLLLECANVAEQSAAPDGGPEPWMADVLAVWRSLLGASSVRSLTTAAERCAITAYRAALVLRDPAAARVELERASRENPFAGEPHILRALCLDTAEAQAAATLGAQLLMRWGVSWDKRASHASWRRLAARIRSGVRDRDFAHAMGLTLHDEWPARRLTADFPMTRRPRSC